MIPVQKTKEDLLVVIENLPDHKLAELLQFANFLLYAQQQFLEVQKEESKSSGKRETGRDPLSKFIGAIELGSLAQDIDKEIYFR